MFKQPKAQATNFSIKTGYYIGNGATRSIIGLGFQPDIVFIKSDTTAGQTILKTKDMSGDSTAYLSGATANFTGGVTSLDSDGFTLGTNAQVNSASVVYQWVAILSNGASNISVGTYTGNGSDNRDITGLGFQPDMVIVKGNTTQLGVWKSSLMASEKNEYFSASAELTADGIQSLSADGFQLGTNATVNSNAIVYYYIALKNVAGFFNVGTYTGNNTDNREITGVGFKPNFVFVKQASTQVAIMRTDMEYGDKSLAFTATAQAADQIQALSTDGFQVGLTNVNTNATVYYYAAFGGYTASYTGTYQIKTGSYTGNGVNPRAITGIGFKPDLVIIKNQSSSGALVFGSSFFPRYISYFIASSFSTNGILSYDADGFTVDGSNAVNGFVYGYDYVAIKGIDSANFRVGLYTGDGLDNRQITGLGFQPDGVIVKSIGSTGAGAIFRTSAMTGDSSSSITAEADGSNRIQQFLADGFEIGSDYRLNVNSFTHIFIAFKNETGKFNVGTYMGDGADNRNITGVGFKPNWMFTKAVTALEATQSNNTYAGDLSAKFSATIYGANMIQSLSSDGFQVGTDDTANKSAVAYYYVCFGGYTPTARSGNFFMNTGNYYGDGTASRSINDVGFEPDVVLVKQDSSANALYFIHKDLVSSTYVLQLGGAGAPSGVMTGFNSQGFQLKNNTLNTANIISQWIAFKDSNSANFKVGFYTGTGVDNREIAGVGFQPDFVIVKAVGVAGIWRNSVTSSDVSFYFSNTAAAANNVQAVSADGFQIGTASNVNNANVVYYYLAFKNTSGFFQSGTYTGNNTDNRSVTGVGFKPDFVFTETSAAYPVFKTDKYHSEASGRFEAAAVFANGIQSLENDGFQIGTDATVNTNAAVYYYNAFKGSVAAASPSGNFKMQVGSYTGTGSALSVTSLEFKPDLLFVKSDTVAGSMVVTISALPNSTSMLLNDNGGAFLSGGVTSLDTAGFTLGTNANVNSSGVTYQYIAFANSGSADFKVGYYSGMGTDNVSINGLGFQPDFVAVKNVGNYSVWRSSDMAGDLSGYFNNVGEAANIIQALESDGFQLGTSANVNTAGSGYMYIAFKANTGKMKVGNYTGNGSDNRSISGVGFQPDWLMVKDTTTNSGVHRSSNLANDNTQYFVAIANLADSIQALESDGFQVGTNATANANAKTYRYIAWKIPPPNLYQIAYRWRNDDGSETGATWAESANTLLGQLSVSTTKRLRFQVKNDNGSTASYTYRLEYGIKETTCDAISSWVTVPDTAGAEAWSMIDSSYFSNGDNTTNVSGISDPSGLNFAAGKINDTSNQTASINLTGTQFTEIEYALQATGNAVSGATYCFRLTNAGSTGNIIYSTYPEVSINSAISISLTTSGTIQFGFLGLGTVTSTDNPEIIQVGSGPVDLDIRSTDFISGESSWILGETNGTDQVKWEFSTNTLNWSTISVSNTLYSVVANLATNATSGLYFKINMPTDTTLFDQYATDVTVVATAP